MSRLVKTYSRTICVLIIIVFTSACATYYEKNQALMQAVYNGKFDVAEKILDNPALQKKKKDILLYYFNRGTVDFLAGKPEESNKYFQQADYYVEDFQQNYAAKAASFLTNPNVEPYPGEGFEQILIHYYTALNYVQLGDLDGALVECKRMQLKLQKITDGYNGKNKYKRDAFVHTLMGIIYDAQKDYNSAFIAYRNALEIYSEDYTKQLGTSIPLQLKKDIIRTAYLTGFYDEGKKYESDFGMKYEPEKNNNGSLVFFWNNGLGPIKDQWSINFAVLPAGGGWVNFVNTDLGLVFPFYVGNTDQSNSLAGLKIIRVAFPKYVTRIPVFQAATLTSDSLNISAQLETVEPVNNIAFKSLDDRMLKEMSEALLRLALKQLAEAELRKQNEGLGAALSIINAATEQADTRNWQLLPYSINYTRISLPPGTHQLKLTASGKENPKIETKLTYKINSGRTTIGSYQTMQFSGYTSLK